jgi:hypothetical protein
MDLKFVPRSEVSTSRKSSSRYKDLIDKLGELEPGGDALEVKFKNEKHLTAMRNVVYNYNRENGVKIRSGKDSRNDRVFFYREK